MLEFCVELLGYVTAMLAFFTPPGSLAVRLMYVLEFAGTLEGTVMKRAGG